MNDELIRNVANKIYDYSNDFEQIDFTFFITDVCNFIIDLLNLNDYVKSIKVEKFYDKNHASKGMCDENGNLYIFIEGIEKSLGEILPDISSLSEYEIVLGKILLYIKTVFHELEHVNQKKMLAEDHDANSLETLIVKLCDSARDGFFYNCFYEIYPTERLADLKALRRMTKVIEYIKSYKDVDIDLLCCYLEKYVSLEEFHAYYEYGYQGPTESYFEFCDANALSILAAAKQEKELELEERVLYGLEISRKEYEKMVMRYKDMDNKIETFSENKKNKR